MLPLGCESIASTDDDKHNNRVLPLVASLCHQHDQGTTGRNVFQRDKRRVCVCVYLLPVYYDESRSLTLVSAFSGQRHHIKFKDPLLYNTHTHTPEHPAPYPDPNKKAHHISKCLGGRISAVRSSWGLTHIGFWLDGIQHMSEMARIDVS